MSDALTYVMGCDPRVPDILRRIGKRYLWQPVPKGLPRYRTVGECHANCQKAVLQDKRLTYVEGAALRSLNGVSLWIGHAWVTLDGEHAIDLTWRGQRVPYFRKGARDGEHIGERRYKPGDRIAMDPAAEYLGVEIPTKDVAKLILANSYYGLRLAEWVAQRSEAA